MSKNTKKKMSQGNIGGGMKQFFVWHGEKFVVAAIAVFALWLAMQGLGYQTLSWQPRELEETADAARKAIENSERTVDSEEIKIFDYAGHAEQIKRAIDASLYRNPSGSEWNPSLEPAQRSAPRPDSDMPESESGEPTESEPSQGEIQ